VAPEAHRAEVDISEKRSRATANGARNLTDEVDGFLVGKRYLLMDRDASFSAEFREVLKRAGVKPVRIPPKAPNCNPHIERFMLSLRSECLDKMVLFGQESLNRATREYLEHYHRERNHQGLDGKIIDAEPVVSGNWIVDGKSL
jgi:transposase InsO family protein